MPKAAAGVGVSTGVASKVRVVLRAVVVRELEDALARPAAGGLLLRGGVGVVVAEEVEGEAVGGVLCDADMLVDGSDEWAGALG